MKILILGAKGMLGRELTQVFGDQKPTLWDREEIDIANRKDVNKKIGDLRPNIIINAAAYTDVDGCESNRNLAMRVNGYAVGHLASIAKRIGAVLVHYSTDYVFDGGNPSGYKENARLFKPLNVYGKSKLAGERLLKKNCRKYYLIRTSWLFGRYGKNFVDTMIKLGRERDFLKVVNDQRGKPTYAVDLAQQTRNILECRTIEYGTYHATNKGIATWYDFARKIFKLSGIKTKVLPCASAEFPRPAKRPAHSILLNTRLSSNRHWEKSLIDYLSK